MSREFPYPLSFLFFSFFSFFFFMFYVCVTLCSLFSAYIFDSGTKAPYFITIFALSRHILSVAFGLPLLSSSPFFSVFLGSAKCRLGKSKHIYNVVLRVSTEY